ncbi:MAG: transcription termination/antitermination protein NusA [Clostridia bacterium]|nr:transcription termination/antitermination protein NusA [Clostridia bacterium]
MAKKANQTAIETSEIIMAVEDLCKEKRINKEILFSKIEAAMVSAYKKEFGKQDNVSANVDRVTGKIEVLSRKTIVQEVSDPTVEISLEEVREKFPEFTDYELGDLVEVPVMLERFGRIAAQTAKQVIVQSIREAERGGIYEEYSEKENEILTAIVKRVEPGKAYVELGRTEGVLDQSQMMPGEEVKVGDRLKVYVLEVNKSLKGPQVMVSRTHTGLVKRLFEVEVPEIRSGEVLIKSISREAGSRTKMAVFAANRDIDPVGACVGPRGLRVDNVVNELKTEKIDIVKWSSDPREYIAAALSPARVHLVTIAENEKIAHVVVPDNQLSLAIGKEGQNARLAARLTGWKIDIQSISQAEAAARLSDVVIPEETEQNDA